MPGRKDWSQPMRPPNQVLHLTAAQSRGRRCAWSFGL
jgi:hypothetical protein